jgi:hypothetical protein
MSCVGPDNFSVRWTGQVHAIEGGSYTFTTSTDDGVRLWVGTTTGTALIDKWIDQGTTSWSNTITLNADQKYSIKMEYYEKGGGAVAKLLWKRPGAANAVVIPQSQLYPEVAPLVDRTLETGGTLAARGENGTTEGAAKAFDNDITTKWLDKSATSWIRYKFPNEAKRVITRYTITSGNDEAPRDPKNWTLQGSDDGTIWSDLDTRTGELFAVTPRRETRTFNFTNSNAYKYYRLNITLNNGGAYTQLSEIRLLGP